MGVEASATHVNEMSNPGRDYPLAMLLLMVAAICLSSVGGLSIAMVIPGNEINLSAGVMQTFTVLMSHVAPEIEWTVRVISALLLLGVLAEIASWIVGPSRGMYVTAQKNLLPAAFAKMNKNGVPVTLVISQLVITSIALIILTNTGGGNNMSFLIALALTVVIYLCAYFMLFIGYIVLVLKHPDLKRTFNIPGGKGVKLVVAIVGLLTSIMAFIVSFLPPDNIQVTLPICMLNYWSLVSWWYLPCPLFSMLFMIVKAKRIPASLWSQSTVRTHQKVTSSCTRVHVHHTIL